MNIRYWVAAWRGRRIPYTFRDGPVPFTACRGASGRGYFRHFETFAERRDNDFVTYDEECREFGIVVRSRRRSPELPNLWDDLRVGRRGVGWKNQRDTQYKAAP